MDFKKTVNSESPLFTKEQVEQEKYRKKCKKMKRFIKDLVYENGALCDQIAILQEKTLHMIDERNYLFKKLYQYQPVNKLSGDSEITSNRTQTVSTNTENSQNKKSAPKKKVEAIPMPENQMKTMKTPVKKPPPVKKKKPGKIVSLDSSGRPVVPVKLGDITIHNIGEVSERPLYRCDDVIYPIGFVSARLYGSLKDPEKHCQYTCKIFDGGPSPRFEVTIEGESEVFSSRSIDELHSSLMERVNVRLGTQVVSTRGRGAQFFGLKNPSVQSLIQASSLRQPKIELSPNVEEENEAAVSFKSLLRSISFSKSHLENYPRESITIGSILL